MQATFTAPVDPNIISVHILPDTWLLVLPGNDCPVQAKITWQQRYRYCQALPVLSRPQLSGSRCNVAARHLQSCSGHSYLFLENLGYVERAARHQVTRRAQLYWLTSLVQPLYN